MSENKRERVLVTGALGVIGSRILPMLARDFDVVSTDVGHSDLPGYVALDRLGRKFPAFVLAWIQNLTAPDAGGML